MHRSISLHLAAYIFMMLLAPLLAHADSRIQLERQLADDELLSIPNSITASLYTSPDTGNPVAVQTYYAGEWQITEEVASRLLHLPLDVNEAEEQALWYELEADGLLLGEREALRAVASGVTLALGNQLDMDGNAISNLEMPAAPGDGLDAAKAPTVFRCILCR
jgi:hypothetical protein